MTIASACPVLDLHGWSRRTRSQALIAKGETVEAIARPQGVTIATVRTRLKGVFARMGISRQLGVARLVRGLPQFDA